MIALVQRVREASVSVDEKPHNTIGAGLLVLLGITHEDTEKDVAWLAQKVAKLRIFSDAEGKMNLSVQDIGGEVLVISQFTLHGDTRKGNRPSYVRAARPEQAEPLYEAFRSTLSQLLGKDVLGGKFGGNMQVRLLNDGPVTLTVDSAEALPHHKK